MDTKKVSALLLAVFSQSIFLGACRSEEITPTNEPSEIVQPTIEPEPTESTGGTADEAIEPDLNPDGQSIVFWHTWGPAPAGDALNAIIEDFNLFNDWNIKVEPIYMGTAEDIESAMITAVESGNAPDIVIANGYMLNTWHSNGVLVDITDYINDPYYGLSEGEEADFYSVAWDSGVTEDGARVGYPLSQYVDSILYNSTWAEELGFSSAPSSAQEFREQACAAAEFNNTDGRFDNDGTGGFLLSNEAEDFLGWTTAFGETLWNESGSGYDFTKPVTSELATFLKQLWDDGCAFDSGGTVYAQFPTRNALFIAGSTIDPETEASFLDSTGNLDDAWDLIPYPGIDGNSAVVTRVINAGIVQSTPERQLASWLFLKFFTLDITNGRWVESSDYLPVRISAGDFIDYIGNKTDRLNEVVSLLPLAVAEPNRISWGTVRGEIEKKFNAILKSDPNQVPVILLILDDVSAQAVDESPSN